MRNEVYFFETEGVGSRMENIFIKNKKHNEFSWASLGNVKEGRATLGEEMPVIVYRMLQYTLNSILVSEYGQKFSDDVFRKSGELAGREFAKNVLNLKLDMDAFIAQLQQTLLNLKIGILRMEDFDQDTGSFTLTVGEDLDCSGLPITDEVICVYDEGFVAGIMEEYSGKKYHVREVDCWASGDRVCRFKGSVE